MSTRGGFGEVGVLGDLLQVSLFPETIERLKALLHYWIWRCGLWGVSEFALESLESLPDMI